MNMLDTKMHRKRIKMSQDEILKIQNQTLAAAREASSADTASLLSAFNLFN